jgi:hypothetical protein
VFFLFFFLIPLASQGKRRASTSKNAAALAKSIEEVLERSRACVEGDASQMPYLSGKVRGV